MKFTKMEGIGNDYIYIDGFQEQVMNPSDQARILSDRHFGIGGDGLVLILPSDVADVRMRIFNADGSEAEMCGNAIRCVGKYMFDQGIIRKHILEVETLAGIKTLWMTEEKGEITQVKVNMGVPILEPSCIPVLSDRDRVVDQPLEIGGSVLRVTCVSMGNPHAVIFVENVSVYPVKEIGSALEIHPAFPRRTNCEFVEVTSPSTLQMRVWERGSGETLACGTGACAALVAGVLNNRCNRRATVKLRGGDLLIQWDQDEAPVYMTGPAKMVFHGKI